MSFVFEKCLRIRPEEVTFARRGFRVPRARVREHLERIGEAFRQGYQSALKSANWTALPACLETAESEFRGFAYEGAAMALDLLDQLRPWAPSLLPSFLAGPGKRHIYMTHVGAGWSMARLRLRLRRRLARLDPVLGWLALDGFGFHEGYFHWSRYADGTYRPAIFQGYALRAFDQGLGRSLWFVSGADPKWISEAISVFPEQRRSDMWSGVGLACAYAGGCDEEEIARLQQLSNPYAAHVAQGVVFAAKTREYAGNSVRHTELSCRMLCGLSLHEAAFIADQTFCEARETREPAYEDWRQRIRAQLGRLKKSGWEARKSGLHPVA
jgi:hypothetical protein